MIEVDKVATEAIPDIFSSFPSVDNDDDDDDDTTCILWVECTIVLASEVIVDEVDAEFDEISVECVPRSISVVVDKMSGDVTSVSVFWDDISAVFTVEETNSFCFDAPMVVLITFFVVSVVNMRLLSVLSSLIVEFNIGFVISTGGMSVDSVVLSKNKILKKFRC